MSVLTSTAGEGICLLTLSRPEAMNALNRSVLSDLERCLSDALEDASIKVIVLTGEGEKAFVAGADIRELSRMGSEEARALSAFGQQLFSQIEHAPKPVIAAINGFALGGGCELAMACHIRLAAAQARLGQPEINLGIVPGYGGTQRLAQLVGRGKALELLLTGDMVSAEEAKLIGLVNHVYASRDEMMAAAFAMAGKIAGKGAVALSQMIQSVNAGFGFEAGGYAAEAEAFAHCAETADFREGTSAFLEKRKPVFRGV